MNRPELYGRTVGILYDAYYKDTLHHGDCCACAVGNIIVANMGYSIVKNPAPGPDLYNHSRAWMTSQGDILPYPGSVRTMNGHVFNGWGAFVATDWRHQEINWSALNVPIVKEQIMSTGYLPEEVILIERAFESAKGEKGEERMFNGLCLVLDALAAIHEVSDHDNINQKKHFAEHYQVRMERIDL